MPRPTISRTLKLLVFASMLAASFRAQERPATDLDITRCWAFSLGVQAEDISKDDARIYVASAGAKISALTSEGKKVWSSEFGGAIISNLVVLGDGLFVVTASGGSTRNNVLRGLSRETGIVSGTSSLPVAERYFLAVTHDSLMVISSNGALQQVSPGGALKWRREIAVGFVGVPTFSGDRLYVASSGKQVFGIDSATGEIESVRKVPYGITAAGATAGGTLAVGDERGYVTSFSLDGREGWRFRTGGRVSQLFSAGGQFFAISHDNFVYCIDVSNGNVLWKRRLDGRAMFAGPVNGSHIFATALDEHGAGLTKVTTGKPAGQIILASDEWVTVAPLSVDGLLFVGTNTGVNGYSLSGPAGCPK